ncbi:MAG: hypothetical protein HN478_15050 [Rhodospirillaceae bacterium]|nr:hypothetical protein [Rhodospirillaceae bacterium]MBT5895073.1 hypothetical protein [Rhodospirillaceae bacterium]MBT6427786.1 hypothetical protein [Rhodospirillaceae bacterium]MBT7759794.1 hypothetical protein [Rhodospirillaceae bacterium]
MTRRRQRGCLAALFLALAACGGAPPKVGQVGAVQGFIGAAIGEEPRAALAARDTLSAGGTAADAATAAYFTMTVTYPVAVGLGGGGVCLYYDHRGDKVETLDFRAAPALAGGAIAVPGALRGMALLHSRYGRLPWAQLVAPAETMARFGHQISRALAKRLAPQAARLHRDATAARIFLHADGTPLDEAETVFQVELASALTRIRTRGVSDLYGGEAGRQLLQAGAAHGGKGTIAELRKYRAIWRETAQTPVGNHMLHHPVLGDGESTGKRLTDMLAKSSVVDTARAMFSGQKLSGAIDRGEAAFVAGDSFGSSVACIFHMNGAFGSAAMVPEMGVFLSPESGAGQTLGGGRGYSLPLLGVNEPLNQTVLAVAGAGGPNGALAAAFVSLEAMTKSGDLVRAMAARDTITALGRVQALWCPKGIRATPETCQFATDPRAYGLAVFDKF